MLNLSFLDIFEKQDVFFLLSFLNLHGLNLKGARNFLQRLSLTSCWEEKKKKANKNSLLDHLEGTRQ